MTTDAMKVANRRTTARSNVLNGDAEQSAFYRWTVYQRGRFPDLAMIYAIPNGAKLSGSPGRRAAQWARLEKEGVRKGIPDYCLPVARGGFHGLYIELKSGNGRATPEQREWCIELRQQGYRAEVCKGWQAAAAVVTEYMTKEGT